MCNKVKHDAAQEAVAYLDIGAGGYLDLGSELPIEQLMGLPKGRHALAIIGTYGIDGYVAASVTAAPVGCNVEGVTLRNDGSTVVTDAMIHAALRVQYARAGSVWTGSKANQDFTDMRHILSAAMRAASAEVTNA